MPYIKGNGLELQHPPREKGSGSWRPFLPPGPYSCCCVAFLTQSGPSKVDNSWCGREAFPITSTEKFFSLAEVSGYDFHLSATEARFSSVIKSFFYCLSKLDLIHDLNSLENCMAGAPFSFPNKYINHWYLCTDLDFSIAIKGMYDAGCHHFWSTLLNNCCWQLL